MSGVRTCISEMKNVKKVKKKKKKIWTLKTLAAWAGIEPASLTAKI